MRYSDDMPRWFIDAKELWKRLIEVRQFNKGLDIPYTVNLGINQAIGELNSIPAADVVEVVRCKDCISRHCSEYCECRPDDFFCADGERKDNA